MRGIRALWWAIVCLALLIGGPWALLHYIGPPIPTYVPAWDTVGDWVNHPLAGERYWKAMSLIGWAFWLLLLWGLTTATVQRLKAVRLTTAPLPTVAASILGGAATLVSAHATYAAPPATLAPSTPAPAPADLAPTLDQPVSFTVHLDSTPPTTLVYQVQRGDWLSSIAERFLGDKDAYHRIAELNPALAQRDARFPNHIEAGWQLTLPTGAVDHGIRIHAAGTLLTTPAAQPQAPPTPIVVTPPVAEPPVSESPAVPPAAKPSPPSPSPAATSAPDNEDEDDIPDESSGAAPVGLLAGAGLLGSMVFSALMAERRLQMRFWDPGDDLPPAGDGRAERELMAAQDPANVERLDLALRNLAHLLADRGGPDIVAIRLTGGDVMVHLAHPDHEAPPPRPWVDEGGYWVLPGYITLAEVEVAPLLPLLATIGSRAGRHTFVELGRIGTLSVTGDHVAVRNLLRYIVCELGTNSWSQGATVLAAGFGDEGQAFTQIAPDRIVATDATTALTTIERELAHRDQSRLAGPPMILVLAGTEPTTRQRLTDLHTRLAQIGQCGIALVTAVDNTTPIGPGLLTLTHDGEVRIDIPGLRVTTDAAALPIDMVNRLGTIFRIAHRELPPAPIPALPQATAPAPPLSLEPVWDDDADPAQAVLTLFDPPTPTRVVGDELDRDLAVWWEQSPTTPRLGILGPMLVALPGPITDSRHALYTEVLLYLLTQGGRAATREAIQDALWFGNPAAGKTTVRKALSGLRRRLGPHPDGRDWIPEDQGWHLADGVLLDWHLLKRLRERARQRGDTDGAADLVQALRLVRGEALHDLPDNGPYRRPYTWIPGSDLDPNTIMRTITSIAHTVARHHLAAGDPTTARWAIDQAWTADPHRVVDELWFDRMQAEHDDNQPTELQLLITDYLTAREAEILEDLPTPVYNRIRALLGH